MNDQGYRRRSSALADMPPELWRLIHYKLPNSDDFKVGDKLGWQSRELISGIPVDLCNVLRKSEVVYKFIDEKGWLLLHYDGLFRHALFTCCFNPCLPWPSCFIRLPGLYLIHNLPVSATFSASLTDHSGRDDLRILIFHSGDRFSVIRLPRLPGQGQGQVEPDPEAELEEYSILHDGISVNYVPVVAEYRDGKFFVLFKSGNILVWGEKIRTILRAVPVLRAEPGQVPLVYAGEVVYCRAVAESLSMIWDPNIPSGDGRSNSFRLVSVEESSQSDYGQLEEGVATTTYFVGAAADVKIRRVPPTSCAFWCLVVMLSIIFFIVMNVRVLNPRFV